MAARRSLGGGRVLGSGKNLAPPTPPSKAVAPTRQAGTGLLSPSESSVSLSSQNSSAPVAFDPDDLTTRAALNNHASLHGAAAAASDRMVCPICSEEMMTLLQLNRHLDDNHANLEEVEQDEVKNWFDQQVKKAKKFQPLAALNQKLRGLEVFESNDAALTPVLGAQSAANSRGASPAPAPLTAPPPPPSAPEHRPDPDEVVTRTHWQKPTGYDACSDPVCGKRLGAANGQVNCRHCGKLFCEEHTMYQIKLSRSAQHEPIRGMWCRVCETCYKSREGYNDHNGFERNHFDYFKSVRRKSVDKQYLEVSRLEKRLTRLTQLLANPPPDTGQSTSDYLWSSVTGAKPQHLKALEQSVVTWEDDASIAECPFCQQAFSQYTFRRHHCRTCGRVVCSDPATGCSKEIGLDVDMGMYSSKQQEVFCQPAIVADPKAEKTGKVAVDVRLCKDCQRTIFSKNDFARELSHEPPDQKAYKNLVQFEHGIRLLLPRFQRLLVTLQDPEKPPSPSQLSEATKTRKRLMDAFTQFDFAARRIRDLPTESVTQQKLQKAIYQQATNFLHVHMLPLKSLPKIMKHATPRSPILTADGKPQSNALSQIKYDSIANGGSRPSSSRTSSVSSAALTALEAEEKELRERLIVLEEQKYMVQEMIADANKRRKFDEVAALAGNVEDLSREIDQIQSQISQMDFAGAYAADSVTK